MILLLAAIYIVFIAAALIAGVWCLCNAVNNLGSK